MGYQEARSDNVTSRVPHTVGTTAVKLLPALHTRAGWRVIAAQANLDFIYVGFDNNVSTTSPWKIAAGGILNDEGEWLTIYRGELWAISETAAQSVTVHDINSKRGRGRR